MRKRETVCFLALEGTLYALFLAGDFTRAYDTTGLKFASIALVALASCRLGAGTEGRLTAVALWLTAAADVFLLVLDAHYAVGVALFLCVQTLYALRLAVSGGERAGRALAARLAPAALAAALLARYGAVTALAAGYILCFAVNLVDAVRQARLEPARRRARLAAGLALFFCCDLCVGLHNLPVPAALAAFARVGMWGFYLPGQVLILASMEAPKGDKD